MNKHGGERGDLAFPVLRRILLLAAVGGILTGIPVYREGFPPLAPVGYSNLNHGSSEDRFVHFKTWTPVTAKQMAGK